MLQFLCLWWTSALQSVGPSLLRPTHSRRHRQFIFSSQPNPPRSVSSHSTYSPRLHLFLRNVELVTWGPNACRISAWWTLMARHGLHTESFIIALHLVPHSHWQNLCRVYVCVCVYLYMIMTLKLQQWLCEYSEPVTNVQWSESIFILSKEKTFSWLFFRLILSEFTLFLAVVTIFFFFIEELLSFHWTAVLLSY